MNTTPVKNACSQPRLHARVMCENENARRFRARVLHETLKAMNDILRRTTKSGAVTSIYFFATGFVFFAGAAA